MSLPWTNQLQLPNVEATAAILIDADTGIIIYEKNAHERRYPASLTKLMTALMLLEHINEDFDQRITMSRNAVFSIPRGSSHIAMNEDETLSAYEALYAIMLESANEVSNAIGEHVAGELNTFAAMMTIRANELGAYNTNFINAHGLHHEDNYTTAYDMAVIKRELLNHPRFVEIISTNSFIIPPTERQPLDRILNNTHRMIRPDGDFFYRYAIGGKTGFTNEAAHTLSTYARNDENIGLIAVVMENQRLVSFTDTTILFDFGFSIYEDREIFNPSAFNGTLDIGHYVDDEWQMTGQLPLSVNEIYSIVKKLPLTVNLDKIELVQDIPYPPVLPIREGQAVGHLLITYQDNVLDSIELFAGAEFLPVNYVPVQEALYYETGSFLATLGTMIEPIMSLIVAVLVFILVMLVVAFTVFRYRRYRKYQHYKSMRGKYRRSYAYTKSHGGKKDVVRGSARYRYK